MNGLKGRKGTGQLGVDCAKENVHIAINMQVHRAQQNFCSAIASDPRKYFKLDRGTEDPNVEDRNEEWEEFYDDDGDENIEVVTYCSSLKQSLRNASNYLTKINSNKQVPIWGVGV